MITFFDNEEGSSAFFGYLIRVSEGVSKRNRARDKRKKEALKGKRKEGKLILISTMIY